MSPRTIFLSRLFGLYFILVALPMMIHKQAVVDMVTGLFRDPAMMFMLGLLTLAAGLAMVLAHNIWSGGALPVVVTILGWLTLVKGVAFLFMMPDAPTWTCLMTLYRNPLYYYPCTGVCLLLGIYLTYGGFKKQGLNN